MMPPRELSEPSGVSVDTQIGSVFLNPSILQVRPAKVTKGSSS